jgi:SAM-dependent methyltransferase
LAESSSTHIMNVQLLASKLLRMLGQQGVAETCRRALARARRQQDKDAFDLQHGTDTSGLMPLWQLDIASANARFGERYQASTEEELVAVLHHLPIAPSGCSFVDLGCGKGRTLLVAARLGFTNVVGVEFARELAETATVNVARAGMVNITVLHADAADVEFPRGNLVVYLYNPFSEEVLERVLEHLLPHASSGLFVVYKTPRCAELLDNCGFLARYPSCTAASHIVIWRGLDGRSLQIEERER